MTEELIRKSDALAVVRDFKRDFERQWRDQMVDAISALPAVTVPIVSQPVRYCPICDIADCATHRAEPAPNPAAPQVMHEDAPAAIIGEIGNQIHNLGCELQNDEDVSLRLSDLACRLWDAAKLFPTEPAVDASQPADPAVNAPDRETYSNKGAECPHCGHLNDPSNYNYSLYFDDTCEWECGACSTMFSVSVYTSYSWTCTPMEDAE